MFNEEWIVTSDTPEKNNPLTAFVLCVVKIEGIQEHREFSDLLQKETLHAFKERSFGKYFWSRITRPPAITVEEFRTNLDITGMASHPCVRCCHGKEKGFVSK